jgi:hypothetical protein
LGYLLTLLLVSLSLVRTLPLVVDLWGHGSWCLTAPGPRRILLQHLKGAGRDLQRLAKFLFFALLVVLLGVGLPSFLRKLPGRMRSLEDATRCAQEHVSDTLRHLCELLLLLTAWKTYKLLVTAVLYAALVPPACLAEAIPRALSSVQARFLCGVVVWFSLVGGGCVLTLQTDSASSELSVRTGFFALFGTVAAVVTLATFSLQMRSVFRNPIVDSSTGAVLLASLLSLRSCCALLSSLSSAGFLAASWSHIFALLLGPLEALQLCSVVLYFFWNDRSEGGSFTFPVVFLFDTPASHHLFDYSLAMGLGSVCVLAWVVVVSLPLVFDSDSDQERRKMRVLQRSPVFQALHVLFSRLLFVSLLATLLRPFSCQLDPSGSSRLVLTTARDELCGGQESFFSGSASTILLIFFVITSTGKERQSVCGITIAVLE